MRWARVRTHVDDLRVRGLVPPRVERADAAGEVRAAAVLGRDVRGVLAHVGLTPLSMPSIASIDSWGRCETGTRTERRETYVVHLEPEEADLGVPKR